MALPASWTDALDRLARQLGDGDAHRQEAGEWLREAVQAAYGVASLRDLDKVGRLTAFQKTCGVVLACEDDGLPDELYDGETETVTHLIYREGTIVPAGGKPRRREQVAAFFARYFGGVALEGPPWRLSASEIDRPTYEEWAATARF